jgi:hypothetical protein
MYDVTTLGPDLRETFEILTGHLSSSLRTEHFYSLIWEFVLMVWIVLAIKYSNTSIYS